MNVLDEARECLLRGWPVAPAHGLSPLGVCTCGRSDCGKNGGKHPRTANGLKDATLDAGQVHRWFTEWPDSNLLIRTGQVGDRYLIVLDCDPRSGADESLAALLKEHGDLPESPRALTGGGGVHYYFWSRVPVKNSAGKLGKGLDVRGVGGYVIAPPSKHLSGGVYQWDAGAHPDDIALAELPKWLERLAGETAPTVEVAAGPLDFGEGSRNAALTAVAGRIRRSGIGEQSLLAALSVINKESCSPPLPDWEVAKIAHSVARYQPGDPIRLEDLTGIQFSTPAEIAAPLPPIPWICEGLKIAPGAVTLLAGSGFGGKTMLSQHIAFCVAFGLPVFGQFPVAKGKVRHFDFEQGARVTFERYQRFARAEGIDLVNADQSQLLAAILPPFDLSLEKNEDILKKALDGCNFAFIDAFRGAFPSTDENDSKSRLPLDKLARISESLGCTIAVIHHASKNAESTRQAIRGSGAIFDACQTVFTFTAAPGEMPLVEHHKNRLDGKLIEPFRINIADVPKDEDQRWGLKVTMGEAAPDLEPEEAHLLKLQRLVARIVEILDNNPDRSLSVASLATMLRAKPSDIIGVALATPDYFDVMGTGLHKTIYLKVNKTE